MFLESKQNYSDAFTAKKLNIKFLIFLGVQKHLILEIPFFLKRVRKAFHQDLKGRWKSNESLWVSLKNASDTRANIVTNAGTLQTMGGNG